MSKQNITMTINESLEDSEKKPTVSVADRIKAIEKAKSEEEEEYVEEYTFNASKIFTYVLHATPPPNNNNNG